MWVDCMMMSAGEVVVTVAGATHSSRSSIGDMIRLGDMAGSSSAKHSAHASRIMCRALFAAVHHMHHHTLVHHCPVSSIATGQDAMG